MKRQTQELGIRDWYGDALVSLQAEPMKVLDGFFAQYGPFVLSGCELHAAINSFDITPGLVVLEGVVAPFEGVKGVQLPVYLSLRHETETDVYHDGNVKHIAEIYKAVATTQKPQGGYVEISLSGTRRFTDAIQDWTHRFITDAERTKWNNKADRIEVEGACRYDYVVDSDEKLRALDGNSVRHVLIKKGTWTAGIPIGIHPDCETITGEVGSMIVIRNPTGLGTEAEPIAALYMNGQGNTRLVNVTAEIEASAAQRYFTVFRGFSNMSRCMSINNPTFDQSYVDMGCSGYADCSNLVDCEALCRAEWTSGIKGNYAVGFCNCENMTRCRASVYGSHAMTSYVSVSGFRYCKFLTNCEATVTGATKGEHVLVFCHCSYMNGCKGTASGAGTGQKTAFADCAYMTNCQGESLGKTNIIKGDSPFYSCKNLTQCHGIVNNTGACGFYICSYMSYCTSTKEFYHCYPGEFEVDPEVNNTLTGGWNRVVS